MKRLISYLFSIVIIITIFLLFIKHYNSNKILLSNENLSFEIKYRGLKEAKDFIFDNDGKCYIAFKNKIQVIESSGKSYSLLSRDDLNISSIEYKDNNLFYTSGSEVINYNIKENKEKVIINNLPNFGDYKESKLIVKDDNLFITIGAATNSGVVGDDNKWLISDPFNHDLSPKPLTLNTKLPATISSGAFSPYNMKNTAGQIILSHFPGNASLIVHNLKDESTKLYAWGIRNIKSIDYDTNGKLYAVIGGMEDRGKRPVKGDLDYIYEIKEDMWYGWPDYSGGDPVNSPKFKGLNNEKISFLLDKHPNSNPPAPLYQHKALNSLGAIVIDKKGFLSEKNSIYFYDSKDNIIYSLNKASIIKEEIKFENDTTIREMKTFDKKLYLLDDSKGQLISIQHRDDKFQNNNIKYVGYFILSTLICSAGIIIWKIK
jgi:hypothetical protein